MQTAISVLTAEILTNSPRSYAYTSWFDCSYQWNRYRHREEVILNTHGQLDDRQSLHYLSEYWDRLLWNGP